MNVQLETITPARAAQYLEFNKNNRNIRKRHVTFLARQIKDGLWKTNGATIVFNGDQLIDGQHRLMAVIQSGHAIVAPVVRGVDTGAFETIDTGILRTAGDVLGVMGMMRGAQLAAAARFVIDYKNGVLFGRTQRPSHAEIAEFCRRNPGIGDSLEFVTGGGNETMLMSVSIMSALHYLMAKKDEEMANALFAGIRDGFQGLAADDPFFVLREKLISNSLSSAKLRPRRIGVFVIKAWNAKRKGEKLKIFKHVEGEDVPKIA
jgi:hypothetical protein